MKTGLVIASIWVVVAMLLYGIGAFVAATFDISLWLTEGRMAVAFVWLTGCSALTALALLPRSQ